MNREIIFRGLSVETKEWIYGYYVDKNGIETDFPTIQPLKTTKNIPISWEIDKNTLGQYTGLTDKNGKKIFEGDIIDIYQTVNGYNQFVIVYNNYQFTAEYYNEKTKRRTHRLYEYDLDELFEVNEYEKEIEVIGNIYENNLESKGE